MTVKHTLQLCCYISPRHVHTHVRWWGQFTTVTCNRSCEVGL